MAEQMIQETAGKAIPAGYKQTEVGVIPEDWALLTIDDIASFSGGAQPAKTFFSSKPKDGYIRLIQIRDYKTSEYETYIPETLARKLCSEYDIMIGRYGPPIFQILKGIRGAYNVALIKAEPKKLIEREYLFYYLKTDKLFSLMDMLSQRSSGQTGVELPALKAYPIPLPPKQEQTAIANVLSDSDALIGALEQLIAKKQAIKSGTMQQLLTGRTRLPAFALRPDGTKKGYKPSELGDIPEDWVVAQLGEIVKLNMGQSPSSSNYNNKGIGMPLIQGNADILNRKTIIRNYTSQITKKAKKGDLILSVRAPVGEVAKAEFDCCIGRGVCAVQYKNDYLYQWLVSFETAWDKFSKGSTFDSINSEELRHIELIMPHVQNLKRQAN
ncbi:restriction endonuclease subunit S [Aeromonas sp. QDB66]|uniref:restriction endonuclease subunit S n=1 Tax=Aeromonas sp. QDB66 TaxID=2989824 RepID=UPI0022E71A26|nr:restriction endonuclease subunit S [Aeromonas sp. QDB66]